MGNTILHAESCHPQHVCRNIPKKELNRAWRNCTKNEDFLNESSKICNRLGKRKYPEWLLNQAEEMALNMERSLLISNSNRNSLSRVANDKSKKTQSYSQHCTALNTKKYVIFKKTWHFLLGYRCVAWKAPTLGQVLSFSLFCSQAASSATWLNQKGLYPCGHTICIIMKTSTVITLYSNGSKYNMRCYINCNTRDVIYVISCEPCSVQYVGHTTQKLKKSHKETYFWHILYLLEEETSNRSC